MYTLVNQERAKAGLPKVFIYSPLEASAAKWNNQMRAENKLYHRSPLLPGVFGECVAQGYSSASSVMTGWRNSPGHKAIILGNYSRVGVAFNSSGNWWTLQFA